MVGTYLNNARKAAKEEIRYRSLGKELLDVAPKSRIGLQKYQTLN
jgi:hypothetical protein